MPSSVRSSLRSSQRAAARRSEPLSLGLEDELSFGSDEDLMETIGEIEVPDHEMEVPDVDPRLPVSSASSAAAAAGHRERTLKLRGNKSKSSLKLVKDKSRSSSSRKDSSSSSSLASSSHLLPPLPPVPSGSTLDLPTDMFGERSGHKRGSLMGAFKVKGLRKWKDDQSSRASFVTDSQSMGSTLSLSKIGSNSSSRPSFSSMAYNTPGGTQGSPAAASVTTPNLPLSLPSPFEHSVSERMTLSGKPAPIAEDPGAPSVPPMSDAHQRARDPQAPASTRTPSHDASASKVQLTTSWTPTEISSAILPGFPATLASLEPITVFSAQAAKRPQSSILASASERNSHGFRMPSSSSRWTPCTLVFTHFKVSISPEETAQYGGDDERTIAHVHVFSAQRGGTPPPGVSSSSPTVRRSKSNAVAAGMGMSAESGPRIEVERRTLSRMSTASVCDDASTDDADGLVLRILFGDDDRSKGNEWLVEMKDGRQLHEWIRHVKKTAIMINAEEMGYGQAIRGAYESKSVSADDLAHKLSVHARAVADSRERAATKTKAGAERTVSGSSASQTGERRTSLDAVQGAAIPRSRSADELNAVGNSKRKSYIDSGMSATPVGTGTTTPTPNGVDLYRGDLSDPDSIGTAGGLFAGMSLSSGLSFPAPPSDMPSAGLSFPAPPSDLPPPRPPRVHAAAAVKPPSPVTSSAPAVPAATSLPGALGSPPVPPRSIPSPVHDAPASTSRSASPPSPLLPPGATNVTVHNVHKSVLSSPSDSEDESYTPVRPPTPPRHNGHANGHANGIYGEEPARAPHVSFLQRDRKAPSIANSTNSANSSTSRLRRLRGKPQVIDIMAEFSAVEAENMPPQDDDEPIREDRERRIRFAGI